MKVNRQNLLTLMSEQEYNCRQLSIISGVTPATMHRLIHRGTATISTLGKISKALGVDINAIVAQE